MASIFKYTLLSFVSLFLIACETETKMEKEKTMTGVVHNILPGKDGYIAEMTTPNESIFAAVISISNLGGSENYQRLQPGDVATLTGKPHEVNGHLNLMVTNIIEVKKGNEGLVVKGLSFMGIAVGDKILTHQSKLVKGVLKNVEGEFKIFYIKNPNGQNIAYCLPDPTNEFLVGQIVIQSPEVKMENGISVGTAFHRLTDVYPDLKVYGSEIEGWTYAIPNKEISYLLDVPNFQYELSLEAISDSARVKEIRLN